MKPKIGLITLGVTDLERSTRFYRDGLGLPQHGDYPGVTFFALNGTWLGLYPRADLARDANMDEAGTGFRGFSLAHNVGSTEEVDSVLMEAEKAGGIIVKEAKAAEWGGYSGYFSDPDGFLWEVAWNPDFDLT
ncbi:MAG TPA: VOC family protein [Kiritimatiellia bacterium]|nr:VOC family protein [Kiritimatiellia bacterium]HMP00849.1 VOC family protein [Kiritimatiellia bacterium]